MHAFRLALLAALALVGSDAQDQCATESLALGNCLDTIFDDADEAFCETCLETVALAASVIESCENVTNTACVGIASCACGDACGSEILDYLTCEINKERTDDGCPSIECTSSPPTAAAEDIPTAAPAGGMPMEAPPTSAAETPTEAPPSDEAPPTSSASNPLLVNTLLFVTGFISFLWN